MPTLNQIAVLIAEQLRRPLDVVLRRQLRDRINFWRTTLIRQTLQRHPLERAAFLQTIYLKMSDQNSFCNTPLECIESVSVEEVPTPLIVGATIFDYVGTEDGSIPFRMSDPGTSSWLKGRYSDKFLIAKYEGKRIKVHKKGIPAIKGIGVFEDPEAAALFGCGTNEQPCTNVDQPYPIRIDLIPVLMQMVIEKDYGGKFTPPTETQIPVQT